jgi:hypothetical protein
MTKIITKQDRFKITAEDNYIHSSESWRVFLQYATKDTAKAAADWWTHHGYNNVRVEKV